MAKYSKRKSDGRYVANRIINGRRKVFYGKTCKEIDEKIQKYILEGEQGRLLSAVAGAWRAELLENGSRSAIATYAAPYKRILAQLGSLRMAELTTQKIQKYIWDFAAKGYKKDTVNTELTVIKDICRYGILCGDIAKNPTIGVVMPEKLQRSTRKALTQEQEQKVKAFRTGDLALLGQLLIYTGMRRGELMALTWQDIDLKAGVISVTKKINYSGSNPGVLEDHLKSHNGRREIPIWSNLRPLLPPDRIGLVFSQDGHHLSQKALATLWTRYCIAAGLADKQGAHQCTPHQFRHTFATLAYEANVDIKTCARWMGDTERVVARIYQELRPNKEEEGVQKMDEYLMQHDA